MNGSGLGKIMLMFLVAFVFSAGLSLYVYVNGRALISGSDPLMTPELPILKIISRLQFEVAALEPIFYEHYASLDREAFLTHLRADQAAIDGDMNRLTHRFVSASRKLTIRSALDDISELADDLDETLGQGGADKAVDWDRARALLADVSETRRQVNSRLNAEAASIHKVVRKGGMKANENASAIINAVIGLMAAFAGYYVIRQVRRSAAAPA